MSSFVTLDEVRVVEDAPQVARDGDTALVSPEVVVIAAIPLRATGTDANVQVRGVTSRVLQVRDNVKIVEGRFIRPGVAEAVIGRGARDAYAGLEVGKTVALGAGTWEIVGMFDSDGSAFDSEVWADATVLNGNYDRPPNVVPVGHRPSRLGRRLRRLQGHPGGRPPDHRRGPAGAGVLREPVAGRDDTHHRARERWWPW